MWRSAQAPLVAARGDEAGDGTSLGVHTWALARWGVTLVLCLHALHSCSAAPFTTVSPPGLGAVVDWLPCE